VESEEGEEAHFEWAALVERPDGEYIKPDRGIRQPKCRPKFTAPPEAPGLHYRRRRRIAGRIPMKPNKRSGAPRAPERGKGGDVEDASRDERVDSIEGEEGNGGAYGRPRPSDEGGKSHRSRERG
jgi:hypothetical protein